MIQFVAIDNDSGRRFITEAPDLTEAVKGLTLAFNSYLLSTIDNKKVHHEEVQKLIVLINALTILIARYRLNQEIPVFFGYACWHFRIREKE